MALDDKDKKFIKDTIDDSVSKNVESQTKKTETAFKREYLSRSLEERKQREKYIEELKQLQDNGQATMAQKFELFKEQINKRVPEDLKDTLKDVKSTVGSGAGKVGSGLNKAMTRLMNLNPITAMLWNNKDIVGDIIGGTAQMGWGLAKGAVGGAAGLLNNATNNIISKVKKDKDKKEEEKQQEEIKQLPIISGQPQQEQQDEIVIPEMFSEESNAEKMSKFSEDMGKKINEIHEVVSKEQKGQAKELAKGLGGMQKTMDAIKQVTDVIQAKQKLIVAGVLIGAAAIIGLAAWFQNGGFANLLKMLKNPLEKPINDSFTNKDTNQTNAYMMDSKGSTLSGMTGKLQQTLFTKSPEKLSGIASTDTKITKALDGNGQSFDLTTMKFKAGDLTPVLAPYDGGVDKLNKQTNKTGDKIVNVRWVMIITAIDNKNYPTLKLKNLTSPQVKPGDTFKKGDIIAYATNDFSIENVYGFDNDKMKNMSGYQDMVNKAKANNYKDNLQRLADTKDDKKTEKLNDFMYKKDRASYNAQKHDGDKVGNATEKIHDFFHNKNEDIERNRWEAERLTQENELIRDITGQKPVPNPTTGDEFGEAPNTGTGSQKGTPTGGAANIESENEKKVQQNNEQLKQSTQRDKGNTDGQGVKGQLPNLGTNNVTIQQQNNEQDIWSDNSNVVMLDKQIPQGYGMQY